MVLDGRMDRTYAFGDYEFRASSGELRRPDGVVSLAPQPAALLTFLLEREGRVVAREQLINALWPHGFIEADVGLNQCIRQVRRALGDDARDPRYVETLPRRGYRFLPPVSEISSDRQSGGMTPTKRRNLAPRWAMAAAVLSVVLVTFLAFNDAGDTGPVIAVLPFETVDESAAGRQHGLAFQSHVTVALTEIADGTARIIGPASNVGPTREGESDRQVGRDLGAQFVISGTISPEGDGLSVFAQLVRVADGTHLLAGRRSVQSDDLAGFGHEVGERVWDTLFRR